MSEFLRWVEGTAAGHDLALLVGGILGLAVWNLVHVTVDRATMVPALGLAALTGAMVAGYTTYEAYGIRATADPFTFLASFLMLDGIFIPLVTQARWRQLPAAEIGPLMKRGALGAFVAYFSFGSVMLATRLDKVGAAAVLRETSTVFAALIGWLVLGEKVGPARAGLMALIAIGAVIMEWAGQAMAERKINPILKQVLELGPTVVFFLIYMRIKDQTFSFGATEYSGFIVAALILVPLLLVATLALWLLTGTVSRMQIFVGVMVVFFGGLTAWFNDATFFKMKTTFVYGTFALILGAGLLRGKSLLQWVMAEALSMKPEGWMILTRRLAAMFAGLAVANEIIWRSQSEETWVILETFAMPAVLFVFLMANFMSLQRYLLEEPKDEI